MTFLFDVTSVLMISVSLGYVLLIGVAYSSYKRSGSKFLLLFMGAFAMLFIMNLYGGMAGAYHPFNGIILEITNLFGVFSVFFADFTVKNMIVFEAIGVIAIFLFIIALFKA
ncbi:MAG: hypothetical protein ACUVXA_10385 [Candidatus Jordarchaeum sp.]|uniref:hypothetical protein n=1 Tax=Candidatus Jordarchaeum sp. TaxID=2823881 RepID=UPI00404A1E57